MRYLDANVFVFAVLDEGPRGDHARAILRRIVDGDDRAATSALTIDEVVWVLQKHGPRDVAVREGQRLLGLPNLRVLDVTSEAVLDALSLMEMHRELEPRDAIHSAVALSSGIYTIVSDDADLDAVPDLVRDGIGPRGPDPGAS